MNATDPVAPAGMTCAESVALCPRIEDEGETFESDVVVLIGDEPCAVNVAAQLIAADIVTLPSTQSALPLQPPKLDPAAGVAVSVTLWTTVNGALQAAPQLMPAGLLVTVPLPVPTFVIVRVFVGVASRVNVAVHVRFADIVTVPSVQSASPLQAVKDDPDTGVGVRTTI